MKVACIGGGPGGLYFSILLKKAKPDAEITVYDRNARGSTFGWGVVLSDEAVANMRAADQTTADEISATLAHWDDIEVHFKGSCERSSGHGFCGIARDRLLDILERRAEALGVRLEFNAEVEDPEALGADLVVACDGLFSRVRARYAEHFKPDIERHTNRFVWLGTKKIFDAFTFIFVPTRFGWFQAHCYRFDDETSTFIVECREETWRAAGIDRMTKEEGIRFCEDLFKEYLDGHALLSKSAHLRGSHVWINFERVSNENWAHGNIVLLGDAAASAHFSIGSGTRLCVESAISLAKWVSSSVSLQEAFKGYQKERLVEVLKLQNAARNSREWFETVALREHLPPKQFAYSLLTRSQRVSHENLRLRDKASLESYERWLEEQTTGSSSELSVPPMFLPLKVGGMTLSNRVAVSPMAMYSAQEGVPNDFHLVHLGSRALGGAGLIFTEMTCVSPEGRITPGCAGIYTDEQANAWKRIVDFVHAQSPSKIALQLGHSGPKGSTKYPWEGEDEPLDSGNWGLLSPSGLPYSAKNAKPKEATKSDLDRVKREFIEAAKRGAACGFDMLELHFAHGYLLSSFLSPLTNRRKDEYGGDVRGRVRFPAEILSAVRGIWPSQKPISVRISAVDWVHGGNTIEDAVEIAKVLAENGADIIDVSSGQVSPHQKPVYGRMWQTPFAEEIKAKVRVQTMAVGNIFEADHVNTIIASGRADLCLLARPHLADPAWTIRTAAELGYTKQWWPKQYLSGKRQLETNMKRKLTEQRQ